MNESLAFMRAFFYTHIMSTGSETTNRYLSESQVLRSSLYSSPSCARASVAPNLPCKVNVFGVLFAVRVSLHWNSLLTTFSLFSFQGSTYYRLLTF